MTPQERRIDTPQGEGILKVWRARKPMVSLLMSHGAGGGTHAGDLQALAAGLPRHGVSVFLFEQPWRVAGRRVAGAPSTLDSAFTAAADAMRVRTPLIVGGRSAGARSAARTARNLGARGVLALSFPVHGTNKNAQSRLPELTEARLPTLVIQGERDNFGHPDEFPAGLDLCVIPGADHGLKVPKRGPLTQDEAWAMVVESALEWIVREVSGPA